MLYVQSVLMPKILYCAEIIKIPESKIQGWQALLVSAALGIERKEISAGFTWREPVRCSVMCDIGNNGKGVRDWNHVVGMQAMGMIRTLKRNPSTLPGEVFLKKTQTIVNVYNYTSKSTNLHQTLKRIDVSPAVVMQYVTAKVFNKRKVAKGIWRSLETKKVKLYNKMLDDYQNKSELNLVMDMGEQVEARGRGTGVLFPSSLIKDSMTQQGKFGYNNIDVKYTRMLKCGQIAGIKLNKVSLLKNKQWGLLSLHSKQQMLKCDCTESSVQDIQHLVYECVARAHLMDEVLLKTRELLFKFGEEYKVDIWDKLPRGEEIESMLSGLQKYDLESGVDNANLERQVKGIHRAMRNTTTNLRPQQCNIEQWRTMQPPASDSPPHLWG